MLCPECGRPTMIKYSVQGAGETMRARECSQGHLIQTIKIQKKSYTSLHRFVSLLDRPTITGMELKMAIANLIGDL